MDPIVAYALHVVIGALCALLGGVVVNISWKHKFKNLIRLNKLLRNNIEAEQANTDMWRRRAISAARKDDN
jgi:hypothetical protein